MVGQLQGKTNPEIHVIPELAAPVPREAPAPLMCAPHHSPGLISNYLVEKKVSEQEFR